MDQALYDYVDKNSTRFVKDLMRLCQQPSVSARNWGMRECAQLVKNMMEDVGIETKIIEGYGFPIVFGELKCDSTSKTLGFYNHYDVTPPEPLDRWASPPFTPDLREGKIYARGVADNKNNIVCRLKAVESILMTKGKIPINLRFLVEGEEEIGSPHLSSFIEEKEESLRADAYIWETGYKDESDRPVITLGSKGILIVELEAKGSLENTHSARTPLVPNPLWHLVWALSSIKAKDEMIKVEEWYDGIVEPSAEELELLKSIPFAEDKIKKGLGLKAFLGGSTGPDALRRLLYEPTCNIGEICTEGATYAVIPSSASAEVEFRIGVGQRHERLFQMLKRHLRMSGFGDIELKLKSGYDASKTPPDDPFAKLVVKTAEHVYGAKPVVMPISNGSTPMCSIRDKMKIPVINTGCRYYGSKTHAPNENIRVNDFVEGIKHIGSLILSYSSLENGA